MKKESAKIEAAARMLHGRHLIGFSLISPTNLVIGA
jgi:hypothetical protein